MYIYYRKIRLSKTWKDYDYISRNQVKNTFKHFRLRILPYSTQTSQSQNLSLTLLFTNRKFYCRNNTSSIQTFWRHRKVHRLWVSRNRLKRGKKLFIKDGQYLTTMGSPASVSNSILFPLIHVITFLVSRPSLVSAILIDSEKFDWRLFRASTSLAETWPSLHLQKNGLVIMAVSTYFFVYWIPSKTTLFEWKQFRDAQRRI